MVIIKVQILEIIAQVITVVNKVIKRIKNQRNKINKLITVLKQYNYKLKIIIQNTYIFFENTLRFNLVNRKTISLPFLMSYFDLNFDEQNADIVNFCLSIGILSLLALLGFINIISYLLANYLIFKYDVENKFSKYPKIKKLINYSQKGNYLLIIFEILFVICILLFISGLCLGLFISLKI